MKLRYYRASPWVMATMIALGLAGCNTAPPPADTSKLADPASGLLAPVKPLPDMPECKGLDGNAKLACRAKYDTALRGVCVDYGEKVIGWQQHWATVKDKPSKLGCSQG